MEKSSLNFALCNIQILSGPESCASLLSCDPLVISPAHLAETCQLAKLVCVGFAGWVCSLLHRQNWKMTRMFWSGLLNKIPGIR